MLKRDFHEGRLEKMLQAIGVFSACAHKQNNSPVV